MTNQQALANLPPDLLAKIINICPNDIEDEELSNCTDIKCRFKETKSCNKCTEEWLKGKQTIFQVPLE